MQQTATGFFNVHPIIMFEHLYWIDLGQKSQSEINTKMCLVTRQITICIITMKWRKCIKFPHV